MSKQNEKTLGELADEIGLGDIASRKVRVYNLTWLMAPLAFYIAYEWAFKKWAPSFTDADTELAVYQLGLFILVVGFTLLVGQSRLAGWTPARGLSWAWVAGPLWLALLTPLGIAGANIAAAPEKLFLWLVIPALVGVVEETLFRGFMLRGLMRSFSPVSAVVMSSLAFGALHLLTLGAGGDPVFVAAQVASAAGVGAVLAAMTLRAGSILPAIAFHFAVDVVGLAALGGYENAIQSVSYAPALAINGLVFFVWGVFWAWRAQRKGKVQY